jgi:hypothetical protein
MRSIFLILSVCLLTSTAFGEPIKRGQILCDVNGSERASFALIELRSFNRTFSGSFDLTDLRFKGQYNPQDRSFSLSILRYDLENLEEGALLAQTVSPLEPLSLYKLTLPALQTSETESKSLEIYCRAHWD